MTSYFLWQNRIARFVSHVLSPAGVAAAVFGVPLIGQWGEASVGAGVAALVMFVLLPVLAMIWLRKRGLTDVYNPHPILRQRIIVIGNLCYLLGYTLLTVIDAPLFMTWSAGTFTVAAGLVWVIDRFWKISIHSVGVAGGVFIIMVMGQGEPWPLLIAPGLVAWARLTLGAHTVSQLFAGTLLGILIPAFLLKTFL